MYLANSLDPDRLDSWPSMTINGRYVSGKTSSLFFFFNDVVVVAVVDAVDGDGRVDVEAEGTEGVEPSRGSV
jgi:hypothetical protein